MMIQKVWGLGLLCISPLYLRAQSAFQEGQIRYQADTVRRLEPHPAAYIATQLVVYRKAGATRLELWRVNRRNPADTQKEIQVRNLAGTYTWVDYSDRTRAARGNFALFVSYQEEQQLQQDPALARSRGGYQAANVLQQLHWLGLPAERIALAESPRNGSEVVVTKAIDLSLEAFFPALHSLPGTALQFTYGERGWLTHYTAKALTAQPVADALFTVDPRLQVTSLAEIGQLLSDFE